MASVSCRPLFKDCWTSSLEGGEPEQVLGKGKTWSEGSDPRVRGRREEAELKSAK